MKNIDIFETDFIAKVKALREFYGENAQKIKALEEFSKLSILLARDVNCDPASYSVMREEIADCFNMLLQLMLIYEIEFEDIEKIASEKIDKAIYRMKNVFRYM